jgi:hypothetical protein
MAAKTIAQLKALWVTGYTPTQSDFDDLFDSYMNMASGQPGVFIHSLLTYNNLKTQPGTSYSMGDILLLPGQFIKCAYAALAPAFADSLGNSLSVTLHTDQDSWDFGLPVDMTGGLELNCIHPMTPCDFNQFVSASGSVPFHFIVTTNGISFSTLTAGVLHVYYEIGTL